MRRSMPLFVLLLFCVHPQAAWAAARRMTVDPEWRALSRLDGRALVGEWENRA